LGGVGGGGVGDGDLCVFESGVEVVDGGVGHGCYDYT
jgi:hypothetical protein